MFNLQSDAPYNQTKTTCSRCAKTMLGKPSERRRN